MKTLLKVVITVLICVVVLLVVLRITGFGPHRRIPGLWLNGTLVATPVTDWSFAAKHGTLEIQTRTWYLLPHSVTTACIEYMGQLYVGSIYEPGLVYPHGRSWNENVARDPRVRIKIGDRLYDGILVHITDQAFVAAVLEAEQKKSHGFIVQPNGSLQLFHLVQTGATTATTAGP